jgi:hypothetical protein
MVSGVSGMTTSYQETAPIVGCHDARGLVAADLDRDGDSDLVVSMRSGPLRVFENRAEPRGAWIQVTLRGRITNRDGIGALVRARLSDGRTITRLMTLGGVVHSSPPAEILFGLRAARIELLEVDWPSGRRTSLDDPDAGALVITEPDQ